MKHYAEGERWQAEILIEPSGAVARWRKKPADWLERFQRRQMHDPDGMPWEECTLADLVTAQFYIAQRLGEAELLGMDELIDWKESKSPRKSPR